MFKAPMAAKDIWVGQELLKQPLLPVRCVGPNLNLAAAQHLDLDSSWVASTSYIISMV